MRETHLDQIERWANFVRTNPDWKRIHTQFINAIFAKHQEVLQRILASPGGKEKIVELYGIKNKEGYSWLNS